MFLLIINVGLIIDEFSFTRAIAVVVTYCAQEYLAGHTEASFWGTVFKFLFMLFGLVLVAWPFIWAILREILKAIAEKEENAKREAEARAYARSSGTRNQYQRRRRVFTNFVSGCYHASALRTVGVSPGASIGDLERAYRIKSKQCHPDLHPDDPMAKKKFQSLGEAYEFLKKYGTGQAIPTTGRI